MDQHGLRQSEFAQELGSQGVVSEILSGKREMNLRQMRALAEFWRCAQSANQLDKIHVLADDNRVGISRRIENHTISALRKPSSRTAFAPCFISERNHIANCGGSCASTLIVATMKTTQPIEQYRCAAPRSANTREYLRVPDQESRPGFETR